MNPLALVNYIVNQPLNRNHKIQALIRFFKWQISSKLNSSPIIHSLTAKAKLIITKGMTGATQNIYCGLSDYEDMFFLLHFLRKGECFADIGANIGSYTILASGHIEASTVCFEPVPATYQRLLDNIRINGIDSRVKSMNIGLSSKKGELYFTNSLDTMNHIAKPDDKDIIKVHVDTLDDIVKENVPTLIKIDVEGFETEVLKGAGDTLKDPALKAIIIELNGSCNKYGYNENDIHDLLVSHTFLPYTYDPKRREITRLPTFGSGNTIYLRDETFVLNRLQTAEKIVILNEAI